MCLCPWQRGCLAGCMRTLHLLLTLFSIKAALLLAHPCHPSYTTLVRAACRSASVLAACPSASSASVHLLRPLPLCAAAARCLLAAQELQLHASLLPDLLRSRIQPLRHECTRHSNRHAEERRLNNRMRENVREQERERKREREREKQPTPGPGAGANMFSRCTCPLSKGGVTMSTRVHMQ